MAFSPKTRLVYIPVIEKGAIFSDFRSQNGAWRQVSPPGSGQMAAMIAFPDGTGDTSRLEAWDPATHKPAWTQPTAGNQSGGVVATGGGLVFQGQLDGRFNAYAADTGRLLWRFDAKAPVVAPPITYLAGGRQYVSVQTGMGGGGAMYGEDITRFGIDYRTQRRRILTFAIGGSATLPPSVAVSLRPLADPQYEPDEASAARGAMLFGGRCVECHGINAVSGGSAPDLRTSDFALSPQAFGAVVRQGALLPKGMPRFDSLTATDAEDIRQYVRSRAAVWRDQAQGAASRH
jgi:quinohemoprotein ethanol dehydrogenase